PATGNHSWHVPEYWDLGVVPNESGATVIFPQNNKANVDITGAAGGSVTLGVLTVNGTVSDNWSESRWLYASDDTDLIWDNDGDIIRINWFSMRYWGNFNIQANQIFTGRTHLRTTTTGPGNNATLCLVGPSLGGVGPVNSEGAYVSIGAAAGATNVVSVPIAVESPQGEWNITWISGGGTVIYTGNTNTQSGSAYDTGGLIRSGAQVVLEDKAVMYMRGQNYNPRVFAGANNSLRISDASYFDTIPGYYMRFGGHHNTVLTTGPESVFNYRDGEMDGYNNSLIARDGGIARIREANTGGFGVSGGEQTLCVSGGESGLPGIIDLLRSPINFASTDGAIILQPGGVITNTPELNFGNGVTTGGRVLLEGGLLYCDALNVHTNNAIAPVFGAGEIMPVKVLNSAAFAQGAKVAPVNPDRIYGSHTIVELVGEGASFDFAESLADMLDAPDTKDVWSLRLSPDGKSLIIACSPHTTLIIIR
ncbi:MAG: hypothetical protein FWG05_05410, partial [Kiritimatiellaeota bacterium]|nr:hypothetical protein [Kiritimatiellota bacterium]